MIDLNTFEAFGKHVINAPPHDHQNIFSYHWEKFMREIEDDSVDMIITIMPSKLKDADKFLEECQRVIKDGGKVLLDGADGDSITEFTAEGDLVIDPFIRDGKYAVLAVKAKRRFIGGDLSGRAVKNTRKLLREIKR